MFEVLAAVLLNVQIFWDVTLCRSESSSRHFDGSVPISSRSNKFFSTTPVSSSYVINTIISYSIMSVLFFCSNFMYFGILLLHIIPMSFLLLSS